MLFEYGREIVNIVVTHGYSNLRKVHGAFLDHPLGFLDPQSGEIGDDGITGMLLEDPLQLGDADVLTGGKCFQGDFLGIMLSQVFLDLHGDLGMVMQLIDGHSAGIEMNVVLVPVNEDQEVFKKIFDDLLGTEGNIVPGHQVHTGGFVPGIHIVEMSEGSFRFL